MPAACCVHAAAASGAGHAFQGKSSTPRVKKKVLFVSRPEIKSIPVDGRGVKLVNRPRRYSTCYPNQENCPKPDSRDARYRVEAARLLEQAVKAMLQGIPSLCDYECPSNDREDFNVTCQHCEEVSKTACAGALAGIQFLADTGSEEDRILFGHPSSERIQASKPYHSKRPRARRQVREPQNFRVFERSGMLPSRKYSTRFVMLVEGAWTRATGFTGTQGKPRTL